LIRDTTAQGARKANYTKSLGKGKRWVIKPREEWVIVKIEPIISEELWNQCNSILDEQKKRRKKKPRKAVHLFAGFVKCHCGQKMYVPSNSPKYICHKCRNKIRTDDLEEIFQAQLKNFLLSPEEIEKYLNRADEKIAEKRKLLGSAQIDRQKLKVEMELVYKLYIGGEISSKGFGERNRPMEERLDQLENRIIELQGEIDFLKIQYLSSDEVFHEARDLYSRWNKLNRQEKFSIVQTITENIIISTDEILINLKYLPPFCETDDKSSMQPQGFIAPTNIN
jgi:site-specific DNA recombinase